MCYLNGYMELQIIKVLPRLRPGPGKSCPFPVLVILRNKPGLTGTIFTKVLFVQDCKYLL